MHPLAQYTASTWQWIDRHRIDLVFFLGLGLCVLKFMAFLDLAVDIKLHDETYYLNNGVTLLTSGLPDAQWAPLYAIWYYLLSLFTRDRIALYYLNQYLLTVLTTLGLYFYLRKICVSSAIAYFASLFYLFSSLNEVDPKPTNFALLVFLIFLIIAQHFSRNSTYYGILAIAFVGILYIRPEYILSLVFFLAIAFYFLFIDWRRTQTQSLNLSILIVVLSLSIMIAIAIFGNPIVGGRSWFAFGQHFSLNWVAWNHSDLNPWTNWGDILHKNFADAENLMQAIQTNPRQFLRHLFSNCDRYLNTSISLLFVSLKKYGFSSLLVEKLIFLQISLLAIIGSDIVRKRNKIFPDKTLQRLAIAAIGILIAIVPSILLIYPREHYLILQGFILIVIIAYLFAKTVRDRITLPLSCLIAFLVFFATPNIAKGWCIAPNLCFFPPTGGEKIVLENRNTLEFIKALEKRNFPAEMPRDLIKFLEAEGGYEIYLGDAYTRIFEWWKAEAEPFDRFLRDREINTILESPNLLTHPSYRDDETFQAFLANPQQYQFIRFPIPQTRFKLLVKQELLN